ncbi:Beta-galactosidase 5 [Phytophthora cinnamomi]|uniref:Beta-galactosidase 5 n=1 Tax=Phytophthora cinnamomi TaxID=4785 RepID=UPI00355A28DE|nr:Beta-galactosidase 5 [Phytophthora cinnamomi]
MRNQETFMDGSGRDSLMANWPSKSASRAWHWVGGILPVGVVVLLMEWLEAHARLEQRRNAVVRRQQRELQRKRREAEARERELQKLAARCREMEHEERLSVAMEAWYRDEEERRRLEAQRLEDLKLYAAISKTRKRMVELGLSLSTPGAAGIQRLRLLELRIAEKELALKKSREAKGRLDALPAKRNKLRQLMHSFFASSVRKKVEHAVYHQHWDRLVPLFDPAASSSDNRSPDLLNHESENGFTPVLVAIFKGKLRVLRQLLELGAAPNAETAAGITPLLAVVMTGDVVALSILVEFKVDLNHETKSGVNAVLLAADKGRENILRALLEYGANVDGVNSDGRSTLVQAAISGNSDLVRVLLAYGASKELRDRGGKAALDWAIQLRNSSIVSILSSSLTSSNLLAQLKAEDEEEDGEVLSSLSTNRVLRRKRMAEMDKAMRTDDLGRIREHLSTEGLQFSPNYEDDNGNTPLLIVCASGTYADVMLCLKSNCIPIHQNREGINALMIACKRGDVDMIQLLMKCGCSMFTRDFSGRDAFYYLNAFDHPSPAIEYTIKHRARGSDSIPALVLGSIISPMNFLKSEYLISLTQADISFTLEGASDGSSRSIDDSISTGPDNANDDNGNEEPVDDSSIPKHAAKAGEDTVFTQLAELELAALYTTQKKYDQARTLLGKVERLVADSLGILHPTMLKIAIGRARISQDTNQFEQCFNTMQDALSLFESVLPLDHKDILTATAILLRSLDATENYCEAVRRCRHVFSIRVRALPASHKCLKEIQEQLDEFIAKRETVNMSNEDLITLHKIEQERRRLERLANESEKHLENFRHLLMEDPEGLATFLTFAKQEFAEDLVTFWISIEEFKENGIDSKTLRSRAVNTYLTYIKSRRIKVITAAQRKKIKKVITTPGKKLQQTIYDDVQAQIFELVYKGVYVRYLAQTKE